MTEKEMIEAMLNSTNCAEQEWFNNGDVAQCLNCGGSGEELLELEKSND